MYDNSVQTSKLKYLRCTFNNPRYQMTKIILSFKNITTNTNTNTNITKIRIENFKIIKLQTYYDI